MIRSACASHRPAVSGATLGGVAGHQPQRERGQRLHAGPSHQLQRLGQRRVRDHAVARGLASSRVPTALASMNSCPISSAFSTLSDACSQADSSCPVDVGVEREEVVDPPERPCAGLGREQRDQLPGRRRRISSRSRAFSACPNRLPVAMASASWSPISRCTRRQPAVPDLRARAVVEERHGSQQRDLAGRPGTEKRSSSRSTSSWLSCRSIPASHSGRSPSARATRRLPGRPSRSRPRAPRAGWRGRPAAERRARRAPRPRRTPRWPAPPGPRSSGGDARAPRRPAAGLQLVQRERPHQLQQLEAASSAWRRTRLASSSSSICGARPARPATASSAAEREAAEEHRRAAQRLARGRA